MAHTDAFNRQGIEDAICGNRAASFGVATLNANETLEQLFNNADFHNATGQILHIKKPVFIRTPAKTILEYKIKGSSNWATSKPT